MPKTIYLMDILKTRCISINHMTIQIMLKVRRKTKTGDIISVIK